MRRLPKPPKERRGTEKQWLGVNFDPKSPRKFLKLFLFDVDKAKLFRENVVTVKKGIENSFTRIAATVHDMNGHVFASVIEPYAGTSFVKSAKMLKIPGAGDDDNSPVAVEVDCVNGRKDVVYMNGSKTRLSEFDGMKIDGSAAIVAKDANGIKYAMLTEGTTLSAPEISIKLAKPRYAAKIESIDFYGKKLTLDKAWNVPGGYTGQLVVQGPKHTSVFNIAKISSNGKKTMVTLKGSPYMAVLPIDTVFPKFSSVKTAFGLRTPVGLLSEWTATNKKATKFWKVKSCSGHMFALDGKVEDSDFPDGKLVIWDIGVGYSVSYATRATVSSAGKGRYIVRANAPAVVSIKGASEYSTGDGKWIKLNSKSVIKLNKNK